jgi:parallel beta-helix repeat protein
MIRTDALEYSHSCKPGYQTAWLKVPFFFAIALLLAIPTALGQNRGRAFYVDSRGGNDSNVGTNSSAPWRTLAKVNALQLEPGDTVYLKRGSLWRETLTPKGNGTPGEPITITAYGMGDPPTVNGSDPVTGWVATSDGIYRAPLSMQPANVYLDNAPGWGLDASRSPTALEPGSWYWDGSALYVRLADGSDPSRHTIEAVVRPRAVFAQNESYLIIDHLRAMRTGCWAIEMLSQNAERNVLSVISNNVVTQNGTNLVDLGGYCNAIYVNYATSPTVEGNTVSYAGGHNAINVQKATNIKILNNDVSEWNHNGLDTKMSDGILYQGNKAHDAPQGNGIYSEQSANITVENNSVYNIGGSTNGNSNGVHIEPARGQIVINRNSISNAYGGIYLVRTSAAMQANSVSTRSGLGISQR